MQNKKFKIITLIFSMLCAVITIIAFNQGDTLGIKNIYTNDIAEMNIGAEMPSILYADENKVIFQGTCGMIVFDIEKEEIVNRITYDNFWGLGLSYPLCKITDDGKTAYIGESNYAENSVKYKYDIKSGKIKKAKSIEEELYDINEAATFNIESYKGVVDMSYLFSLQIIKTEKGILYLRAKPDWSMSSLQVVIYNLEASEETVIDVF